MDPKQAARSEVDARRDDLVDLSHRIHAHPELGFEEERASAWVADALAAGGMTVQHGVHDLPTALVASAGSGPLTVAICAEYDALPRIGHACGHNVIAAAAVGAGLALARVADDLGLSVRVVGTPAEEGGGGKILLLERGAFEGVHAAMMVHPAPYEAAAMACLARQRLTVAYHGRSAHASAYPELGINAADAFTVAQVAIGLLRQHIAPTERIHGIVTHGGDAPNVVPEATTGDWYVRAATLADLEHLVPRVSACFEAGAVATGCGLEIEPPAPAYSEFEHDVEVVAAYVRNAEALGRAFPDPPSQSERLVGSTDMANLSLHIPAIHPMLDIASAPAVNHQPEFAAACVTAAADRALRDGAVAMAWTAIDLASDPHQTARLVRGERMLARAPQATVRATAPGVATAGG